MTKKTKKRIIWGIVIGVILLVAYRTLLPSSIEVTDVLPATGFKQEISLQDEDALRAAENNYTIVVKTSGLWRYSLDYGHLSLKDNKGSEIPISQDDTPGSSDAGGTQEISFIGKPNTSYTLTYEGSTRDYKDSTLTTSFRTPEAKDVLKTVFQETDKAVPKHLKNTLIDSLKSNVNQEENWFNMSPYYTPTEQEKKNIVDAYLESFYKDVTDYQLSLIAANADAYEFKITYRIPSVDLSDLNQRIEERENVLKSELDGDNKKMFQTIVKELPDIIKKASSPQDKLEVVRNFKIYHSSYNRNKIHIDKIDFSTSYPISYYSLEAEDILYP